MALLTLLYGCETWTFREEDKYRITSEEMKCMKSAAKYTWQDYKSNEDSLSELNINSGAKEQKYMDTTCYYNGHI